MQPFNYSTRIRAHLERLRLQARLHLTSRLERLRHEERGQLALIDAYERRTMRSLLATTTTSQHPKEPFGRRIHCLQRLSTDALRFYERQLAAVMSQTATKQPVAAKRFGLDANGVPTWHPPQQGLIDPQTEEDAWKRAADQCERFVLDKSRLFDECLFGNCFVAYRTLVGSDKAEAFSNRLGRWEHSPRRRREPP